MTYAGREVRSRRIGLQRNMEGGENATHCSLQCGQTDECQYWTFISGATRAPPYFYCELFSNITQKGKGFERTYRYWINNIGGRISGRRPCSKNSSIIKGWYEC